MHKIYALAVTHWKHVTSERGFDDADSGREGKPDTEKPKGQLPSYHLTTTANPLRTQPHSQSESVHNSGVKLSSLAAFSPPAAAAKSLIPSLSSSGILSQNGRILLNLTVPIHVPDVAESTLSLPQSTSIRWSKLPAPESNGFVGYGDATFSEKVLDIAKAQSEPMLQPDGMADDLGWKPVASIQ